MFNIALRVNHDGNCQAGPDFAGSANCSQPKAITTCQYRTIGIALAKVLAHYSGLIKGKVL